MGPTRHVFGTYLFGLAVLFAQAGRAQLSQTVISGPVGSGPSAFGQTVAFLPNGNYVVTDSLYDLPDVVNVGAVHLYRGSDHSRIATLTGSFANDRVGGIIVLPNGNYLVLASAWNDSAGAVTWCGGASGCSGVVSPTNSAVGTSPADRVGDSVRVLGNGNYLIAPRSWDDPVGPVADVGAVRFCNGDIGCFGPFTPANAWTGSMASEGPNGSGVAVLSNSNYVVYSPRWGTPSKPATGAATFCSGVTGCVGTASASNSLVGTTLEDYVGSTVTPLSDGNYVVQSPRWNMGGITDAGASTWCDGETGCPPGPVTAVNSLTGVTTQDWIGGEAHGFDSPPAVPLPGGAYVFKSPFFTLPNGVRAGAVTWCGAGGAGCTGATVTSSNSLVGSTALELQDGPPIVPLGSGAFVVPIPDWGSYVGAVAYCDSVTHCQGQTVGATNSLMGSSGDDQVGLSVIPLANGNYVVLSPQWNKFGRRGYHTVGAATFCSGTSGCQGSVTAENSFTSASEFGSGASLGVNALSNGNYVVTSQRTWEGAVLAGFGSVTFCSGTTGCVGTDSPASSLVGSTPLDGVGWVYPLPSGNYLVVSPNLDDGMTANVGAITLCSGTSGCTGPVTAANSILGVATDDRVGYNGVTVFSDDRYVVKSGYVDNGPIAAAGAVTFGHGAAVATVGRVDVTNSLFGSAFGELPGGLSSIAYDPARERFAVGASLSNRVLLVEVPEPGIALALVIGAGALAHLGSRRKRRTRRGMKSGVRARHSR